MKGGTEGPRERGPDIVCFRKCSGGQDKAWKQAQAEGSRGADGVSWPTVSALLTLCRRARGRSRGAKRRQLPGRRPEEE